MPSFPDISILRAIRQINTNIIILVVSMHDEIPLIKQTIRHGANGYLTKDCSTQEVHEALIQLSQGKKYLPKAIAEEIAFFNQDTRSFSPLTSRELDILRMITIEGISLVEIAQRLNISPKTVTSHKSNIMLKLHAQNNKELMALGQKIIV